MEQWSRCLDFDFLSSKYTTPLYVINLRQIKRNFSDYLSLVEKPGNIAFPIKANPSLSVLRCIEALGGSVDCASRTEIRLASVAGFSPERIVYNTPAPDMTLVFDLLKAGATVVLDSENMARELENRLCLNDMKGKIFLRVNPQITFNYDSETDWKDLVSHADTTAKFGIPSENIISLLKKMKHPICGLHIHVGTQMDNIESFKRMVDFLHHLIDTIHKETNHTIKFLDLGGGLGIAFTQEDKFPSIIELINILKPIKRSNLEYWIEPGHSLVGNAVGLLTKVVSMKEMRGKKWGIVDVGTDQLAKVTLLRWPHQVLDSDHHPLPLKGPDSLGGPLCFSGDTLLPSTQLEKIKEGNVLFIQHCGAYCYALGNSFNGRVGPAHLIVEDDKIVGIAKSKEDFFESSNLLAYHWSSHDSYGKNVTFQLDELINLSSKYLRETSAEDVYSFVSGKRIANGSYQFEFAAKSKVNFVAMPFIIRITGDAAIIATCDFIGKEKKDIDIFASRLMLKCDEIIDVNKPIVCQINLSGLSCQLNNRSKYSILAQFSLNHGESTGTFFLSFDQT